MRLSAPCVQSRPLWPSVQVSPAAHLSTSPLTIQTNPSITIRRRIAWCCSLKRQPSLGKSPPGGSSIRATIKRCDGVTEGGPLLHLNLKVYNPVGRAFRIAHRCLGVAVYLLYPPWPHEMRITATLDSDPPISLTIPAQSDGLQSETDVSSSAPVWGILGLHNAEHTLTIGGQDSVYVDAFM